MHERRPRSRVAPDAPAAVALAAHTAHRRVPKGGIRPGGGAVRARVMDRASEGMRQMCSTSFDAGAVRSARKRTAGTRRAPASAHRNREQEQ